MVTGCRKYDSPSPLPIYNDEMILEEVSEIVSIKDFKYEYFYKDNGNVHEGSVTITDNIAIKGKVISDDRSGNINRSIYIYDGTGAIEIKIGEYGTYLNYPAGRTVYIKLKGLVLGNYRYMLSVGLPDETGEYANVWMSAATAIDMHVKKGAYGKLEPSDTIVIKSLADYPTGESIRDLYGCLVRFEGMKSTYVAASASFDGTVYPNFFYSIDGIYETYTYEAAIEAWKEYDFAMKLHEVDPANYPAPTRPKPNRPGNITGPTYAYQSDWKTEVGAQHKFFGSALFKFSNTTAEEDNLLIRTSGYADFALKRLPADGATVDITAIFTKYSSSSGGFQKYQLLLNKYSDVVVR